jgi:hypothetical protein
MSDFKMNNFQVSGATGMDALFASEPQIVTPVGQAKPIQAPKRVKIGSLKDLSEFRRVAIDTLVHKSTNDLWAIRQDGGDYFIERLFQDDGQPLKG